MRVPASALTVHTILDVPTAGVTASLFGRAAHRPGLGLVRATESRSIADTEVLTRAVGEFLLLGATCVAETDLIAPTRDAGATAIAEVAQMVDALAVAAMERLAVAIVAVAATAPIAAAIAAAVVGATVWQDGLTQDRAIEAHLIEGRAPKHGARQIGAGKVGPGMRGGRQIDLGKVGIAEPGVDEAAGMKVRAAEISPREIDLDERGGVQLRAAEILAGDFAFGQALSWFERRAGAAPAACAGAGGRLPLLPRRPLPFPLALVLALLPFPLASVSTTLIGRHQPRKETRKPACNHAKDDRPPRCDPHPGQSIEPFAVHVVHPEGVDRL